MNRSIDLTFTFAIISFPAVIMGIYNYFQFLSVRTSPLLASIILLISIGGIILVYLEKFKKTIKTVIGIVLSSPLIIFVLISYIELLMIALSAIPRFLFY